MAKNYYYFILTLLGYTFYGCTYAQEGTVKEEEVIQEGYQIEVTVEGFTADTAYLANHFGDKQYITDTTTVQEGSFVFSGSESLPGGIYLVVLPPSNNYFEIILDKDQYFSLSTDTADFVKHMSIEGSADNEVFYHDLTFLKEKRGIANSLKSQMEQETDEEKKKELQEKLKEVDNEVQAHRTTLKASQQEFFYARVLKALDEPEVPEIPIDENGKADSLYPYRYYRQHFFDDVDFSDGRLLRTPVLHSKAMKYIDKLVPQQPDSLNKAIDEIVDMTRDNDEAFQYFVVTFLNKYANSKIMGMDAVYVHMVETYYMNGEAFWSDEETIKKMEERALAISPTLIGRIAPNFTSKDINGQSASLHDAPGKYTVLYFWDYDCGHCKKVTPQLAETFKTKLKDRDASLFTVSINGNVDDWKEKAEEYGLTDIVTQDHQRISGFDRLYDVRSTPRLFLLDKDKNILAKQISVEQLEELVLKLEGELDETEEEANAKGTEQK